MKASKQDPPWVRYSLIAFTFAFLGLMVLGPLVNVFAQALAMGVRVYFDALTDRDTMSSMRLTIFVAVIAVVANTLFGLAAAWAIARFPFRGKALLTTLIDLPFSVSPVIAGLIFVLLFGAHGYFGPWFISRGMPIIFAVPGIVIVTAFVTFPFIARELIPVLETLGPDEEEAARTLGASGWQMFRYVTLPNIKWGLLYGILLCNARAIGEFGAVSVVSSKLAGKTDTLPITIFKLYEDSTNVSRAGAFAIATLLTGLALLTLLVKTYLEARAHTNRPGSPGEDHS